MKTFIQYIKSRLWRNLIAVSPAVLCLVVELLYGVDHEIIIYSATLCSVIFAIAFICDITKFSRRHKELKLYLKNSDLSDYPLPEVLNLIEKDYQEIVNAIALQRDSVRSDAAKNRSAAIDYYTLWVHQIKTPIAAMRLILQSHDTPVNKELLSKLFEIEQYVEMALAFLRMDSTDTDYSIHSYNIDSIVRQAVHKYAPMFIRKKIALNYSGVNLTAITDEKWLCFAIEQLLSNAVKYTNSGSVSIYAQGTSLIIEDTGIGIAAEDLPRICEKGFTGYNGRTDKKATGLGLYLCKRTLAQLGHEISFSSQPGKGTKVSLKFETENILYE